MKKDSSVKTIKLDKSLNLNNYFTPPTFDEWKNKVETDLKGKLFETLTTETYEGIKLQPIYTKKDIRNLSLQNDYPGIKRFKRGSIISGYINNAWHVNQEINIADTKKFNIALKNALANGQNTINLTLDTATKFSLDADKAVSNLVADKGLSLSSLEDLEIIFSDVNIANHPIFIDAGYNAIGILSLLLAYAKKYNIKLKLLNIYLLTDPLRYLINNSTLKTKENNSHTVSLECIFDGIYHTIKWAKSKSLKLKVIGISTLPYSNAGATAVQELAYSMATAVEYINRLLKRKVNIKNITGSIVFTYGISTNYFMEIAKLRAARVLWTNILDAYKIKTERPEIFINAQSSSFYETVFDPYVNMLRNTTQTFAAILGGANGITTNTFDNVFGTSNDFSRRIARNTQTILKEESHLDKVIDAAGGSYYLENLTKQLADKSWKLFQNIEEQGGMLNALKEGLIQNSVNNIAEKRINDIHKRKYVIVGTNMFANVKEEKLKTGKINRKAFQKKRTEYLKKYRLKHNGKKYQDAIKELTLAANSCSPGIIDININFFLSGGTLGKSAEIIYSKNKTDYLTLPKLNNIRASEDFEKLRNQSLKIKKETGSFPKIFLANFGSLREYKPRADFSVSFFEPAGFEIISSTGFTKVTDALKEIKKVNPSIIVICSADKKYSELVPQFSYELKKKKLHIPLILAGKPATMFEEYKQQGIDEFIYTGADAFQILSSLLNGIGETKK